MYPGINSYGMEGRDIDISLIMTCDLDLKVSEEAGGRDGKAETFRLISNIR